MGPNPRAAPPASLNSPTLSFPIAAWQPDVHGAAHRPRVVPKLTPPSHTSPRAELLTTCHMRGHRTTPCLPCGFLPCRPPCLTPTRPRPPPPSADALSHSEHLRPSPLDEFDQCTAVSPISSEDHRPARVPPPFSAQLAPHLPFLSPT
jgi:hypothetical protein